MKKLILISLCLLFAISITQAQTATLTNNAGTSADVTISTGGTATLKVSLTGTGPWNFALNDGRNNRYYTATSSPYLISVSPASKRRYSINNLTTNSGNGSTSGIINVIVGTNPTLTLDTPTSLTTCVGGTFEIPYTKNGTWQTDNLGVKVEIMNSAGTSVLVSGFGTTYPTNPIIYQLPSSGLPAGTYKVRLSSDFPYIANTMSTYNITVTNGGCQTPKTNIYLTNSYDEQCIFNFMKATPDGAGYTYEWFKNGISQGISGNFYFLVSSGTYTVRVINSGTGYNQTSPAVSIPTMNSNTSVASNPINAACGNIISNTLTSPVTSPNASYQWFKYINNSYKVIRGANGSSFLATSLGDYKVEVYDGDCKFTGSKSLTNIPIVNSLTANNTTAPVTISGGTSLNLTVDIVGTPPWNFKLVGTDNSVANFTTSTTPFVIPVTPSQNTQYQITNLTNSCGAATANSNALQVIVSPPPSFNISGTSSLTSSESVKQNSMNTNICPGGTIQVAFSITGTWAADREMKVELLNATTNAVIAGSAQTGYVTNPILYNVPSTLPVGTYKVQLTSIKPFITTPVVSTSTVTVSNTSCIAPQATIRASTACSSALLTAAPAGSGYTYQWLKNGTPIANATSGTYTTTQDGNYTVAVSDVANAYSATSAAFALTFSSIDNTITSSSGQICDNAGSLTLASNNVGGAYTHQWYYSTNNVNFEAIASATNNTYTATVSGFYYVIIKNGTCEAKSNTINTCPFSFNFISRSACNNSIVNLPFTFTGGAGQNITVQLVDATTNAVVNANLLNLTTTTETSYSPNITIPNTMVAGTYKFKIIVGSPSNYSNVSLGILTILGQSGGVAPIVTASVSSISSPQNITITATGCQFDVNWFNSDGFVSTSPSFTKLVSSTTNFVASCTDINTGCLSLPGTATVTYGCTSMFSTKSGNWNDTSVWSCGRLPLATDPVQIAPSHTVTLNVNGTVKSLDLRGILQKQTGFSLQVQGNLP